MKRNLSILSATLVLVGLFAGYALAADDAFAVLEQLEKNYVGLEKPGLDTLTAKAVSSAAPDAPATIYYAKGKGLKTKVEGAGPNAIIAQQMIGSFVKTNGLCSEKPSATYKLTKENVAGTCEAATLNGVKVSQLTFVPLKDKKLEFTKLVIFVDTKDWVVRQMKVKADEAESTSDFEYKDGLIFRMVTSVPGNTTTITNTYTTADKFAVPAKMEMTLDGKAVPENMKHIIITYSDVKVNVKIADDIFAAPKVSGDVPKPTETAAELFKQVQEAMMKGDMATAKLKLKQISAYYPDDPMAGTAEMMLKQLPK
ncbi:MAG: hypothetical protein WC980_06940 [Candidatus Brocadiia bacterium]